jgi:hypothetical protein
VIAIPKTRVPTAHRALLAALLACAASCASARMRPTLDPDAYPGVLREPASLARDVVWRQRVTAAWGDERHAFDAVVQVSGDTLTVVGLAPTGSTGFAERGICKGGRSRAWPGAAAWASLPPGRGIPLVSSAGTSPAIALALATPLTSRRLITCSSAR